MYICQNCKMNLPDGANVCPYCKAVQNTDKNIFRTVPNTPHDVNLESKIYEGAPQTQYGINPYSADEGERFWFQQKLTESINDVSTAHALGIVSIVCAAFAFLCVTSLISWICGALGIAKANAAMSFAQRTGNTQIYEQAMNAKKLNKTGIIISVIVDSVSLLAVLIVMVIVFLRTNL